MKSLEHPQWLADAGISQKDLVEVFDFLQNWDETKTKIERKLKIPKKKLEWPKGDIIIID